jgi:8-oxo-dGTP pyrophosphatase MutT (NUDIX family)
MIENPFDNVGPSANDGEEMRRRPVAPRDAATLILVDRTVGELRVLMGRRADGHAFMPGKWVFPGGRVDRSDFTAPFLTELRPEVAARLAKTTTPARARALAMAAVRETFEEVGLLLAKRATLRSAAGPWRNFVGQGALADLAALDFLLRAVTPPASPKRFDTRFFMAEADRLISLDRQDDCGELEDIAWVNLEEAARLDLPTITRFALSEMVLRLADPSRPTPSVQFTRGRSRLTYI